MPYNKHFPYGEITHLRVNMSNTQGIVAYGSQTVRYRRQATFCTYIVKLRRFPVTIVVVEISISYSGCESSIQYVKRIRHTVICGLPTITMLFHIIP